MSYQSALEAAGAKVLAIQSFGSYQGDWYAKVDYKGDVGWITGSFGSCSYCDAFESEFDHAYDLPENEYQDRLRLFGESYLGDILPHEQQVEILERGIVEDSWYVDEQLEILRFVKANA